MLEELENTTYENGCNGVEKMLKLFTSASSTNMHLFDYTDKLKKYDSVTQIIDDYFVKRLELYEVRKKYIMDTLRKELVLLSNKARYINEVLAGTVDLRKKKKEEIVALLESKGYARIDEEESKKDYKYLIKMPMDSVSEEMVEKLNRDHETKQSELQAVANTSPHQMWLHELQVLQSEYIKFKEERAQMLSNTEEPKETKKIKKVLKVSSKTK